RVREVDHAAGRRAEGEAAMRRLLVRATEGGGLISVYEGRHEEMQEERPPATTTTTTAPASREAGEETADEARDQLQEEIEWQDLLRISGELVAAVERAALSMGADFAAFFREARLELA